LIVLKRYSRDTSLLSNPCRLIDSLVEVESTADCFNIHASKRVIPHRDHSVYQIQVDIEELKNVLNLKRKISSFDVNLGKFSFRITTSVRKELRIITLNSLYCYCGV
jgi:hypothetical protein